MSSMNEKYNLVLHGISGVNGECTDASVFNLEHDEYKSIIDALENDRLINKGKCCMSGGYHPRGLTFDGRNFIEHNDSKEYHKIEKTEIHNNLNIGTNNGVASVGNNNIINNSEFDQKFTQLIQDIKNSNIDYKNKIIQELNDNKEDKETLQIYLGTLLTRGAEVSTIVSSVGVLLGVLG